MGVGGGAAGGNIILCSTAPGHEGHTLPPAWVDCHTSNDAAPSADTAPVDPEISSRIVGLHGWLWH